MSKIAAWFKDGFADRISTWWGLFALVVGIALIAVAFLAPDAYLNVKDAITTTGELLMFGGLGGVLWRKQS